MNNSALSNAYCKKGRVPSVSLTLLCVSFQALSVGAIALLFPLIRQDLGLSFTQGGSLAAATTLVYAIVQIPIGYLSDRISPRRLFIVGVMGVSIMALMFGLVTNYWQALVTQVFSGLFRSLLFTPVMALLTGWFTPNRRATAMGLFVLGSQAGNVFFNLAGPFLVNLYGWRVAFIAFASVGIISSLLFWGLSKKPPLLVELQSSRFAEVFQLLKYRLIWLCASIQFVRYFIVQGISYWLPSLLVSEKGISLEFTGTIFALQAVLIAPSNVFGGYISDRLRNPNLVIGVSMVVLAVTSTLLVAVNNIALLIVIVAINAIFLQMYFGPIFSIPVEAFGAERAGISNGISNTFACLGGFVSTYALGALKDLTGQFASGFYFISAVAIVGVLLNFALGKMRRESHSPPLL